MEDIKVGDYIRTPYSTIEKVERIDEPDDNIYDYMVLTDISAYGLRFLKNNKTKHSPNIIDLIEVGDYVNGSKIVDVMEDIQTGELFLEMTYNYTNKEKGDCTIYNKDIKSIVTKEQFKSVSYEV